MCVCVCKSNQIKSNIFIGFKIQKQDCYQLHTNIHNTKHTNSKRFKYALQVSLVTGNYVFETGSMTGILGQLKWESRKKRRKDSRLILLYKGLKGKARIPTDDLIPKNRRCRNQHSLAFQIPSASKEAYKSSFFPQTIRDWNDLPDSLVSSAEMSDDCVSKFASLVRSRD